MLHQDFALYLLAPVPWIYLILHNGHILHKMRQSFQLRTELPSNLHSPIKILFKKKISSFDDNTKSWGKCSYINF